ncbi:MAG TPA: hypothetical protein PK369_07950 [Thermoclostridium sp.]|mgnify:CR=1 FL=1|nr:hypothetical protein [Clostridiaceae bacterium]HOQ76481.1 hypothetical protein [Thermoclostridium sp.]
MNDIEGRVLSRRSACKPGCLNDPENLKCPCPKVKCEWHGKCRECVALHRYYKDHVPNCFQLYINDKIKAIARIGELEVVEKEKTPPEYEIKGLRKLWT